MITTTRIDDYLKDKLLNNIINSDNTMKSYRIRLVAWCRYCNDNDTYEAAEEYLKTLTASYSSVQVKNTLYVLKSFYDWKENDDDKRNPFEPLSKKYRVNKKETHIKKIERDNRVLLKKEISRLKKRAERVFGKINFHESPVDYYLAHRNWFIITMMSEYGMRIGGLAGVSVEDIDFSRRCMMIYDSKNGNPYPIPIKTKISLLRSHLNIRNRFLEAIGIDINDQKALLLSKTGKRMTDTAARRAINRLADDINLYDAGRSTHQIRHYRATQYYKDKMPLDLISTVMGVSVPVLKKTYLHLTDDDTVRQYETWLRISKAGIRFVCPQCGYSENDKETIVEQAKLKLVK